MKTKENCKNQSVNTKDEELEYRVSSPDYGDLIIEMVHKIDNQDYLKKIYSFTKVIYNKECSKKENN